MIYLSAAAPNVSIRVHGAEFSLEPIHYPDVDPSNIIVMEGALGKRLIATSHRRLHRVRFDTGKLPNFPEPYQAASRILPGQSVMVIRGGGIGDVLMCTPVFRNIKNRLPAGARLVLSTFRENIPLFETCPYLDAVVPQPLTLTELLNVDFYLEFTAPAAEMSQIHMTDFYLKKAGFEPNRVPHKRPEVNIRPLFDAETAHAIHTQGSGYRCRIYLNGIASDRLRDLPPSVLGVFIKQSPDTIFFIPKPYTDRYPEAMDLLDAVNTVELDTRKTLAGYVTAIDCCHMVITTDSSAYHIAAALEKPCLALFGPIDPRLRTRYYPSVISLDARYSGRTCRSPCGKSMFSEFYDDRTDVAEKCPEALALRSDFSPCLAGFSTNRLMKALHRLTGIGSHPYPLGVDH